MSDNPRRFELKGKEAEQYLHELATKTFFTDWCYPNAVLGPGKECDLLVVFDDSVVIWQAKDLKLDENGKYSQREVRKNLRQLAGARRALLDLQAPITLWNPRRGEEIFDPTAVKRVFLISALLGEPEDYGTLMDEAKNHNVHMFTREFAGIILSELDTISDFTGYLEKKEELLSSSKTRHVVVQGGEEELLGLYILNNRRIPVLEQDALLVSIEDGHWANLQQRPEYIKRKELDRVSYLWDEMIDLAHTSGSPAYELVARELARLDRFQRRCAAQSFLDAWENAENAQGDLFRRTSISDEMTLCFLFADPNTVSGDERRARLAVQCFLTRGLPQAIHNPLVIGIATQKYIQPNYSYDFFRLYIPEWTDEHQLEADKQRRSQGFGISATVFQEYHSEYPESSI